MQSSYLIQLAATFIKVAFCIGISLSVPGLMVWVERRQAALIQRRVGPNRVGFFGFSLLGLGQSIADTVKLLFKEDIVPKNANKFFYLLAPMITAGIALTAFSAIPFGNYVMVEGEHIKLQAVSLNSGFLYLLALTAIGVYGIILGGWAPNNKYTLLGGMRASAQMISYEIALGMSLLPMVLIYGTLDLHKIVLAQGSTHLWGFIYAPVSCVVFVITMFAETNRLPFDLAESESELVSGFHTEHGSMRFALFFLGEYVMMFVLSALTVCLFFGGYQIPGLPHENLVKVFSGSMSEDAALWLAAATGLGVLLFKIALFMLFFVQVRWTLPRFRYDQLMRVGWRYLLPIAVANVVITAIVLAAFRFS